MLTVNGSALKWIGGVLNQIIEFKTVGVFVSESELVIGVSVGLAQIDGQGGLAFLLVQHVGNAGAEGESLRPAARVLVRIAEEVVIALVIAGEQRLLRQRHGRIGISGHAVPSAVPKQRRSHLRQQRVPTHDPSHQFIVEHSPLEVRRKRNRFIHIWLYLQIYK